MEVSLPVIFGAGVLSFLSPCVLPLVPPYLSYMSGASFEQFREDGKTGSALWRRTVSTSLFFILGFSVVFIAMGATATAFGRVFRSLFAYQVSIGPVSLSLLPTLAGLLIIFMGLHFLGAFRIGLLDRQVRHNGPSAASGPLGGFLLGLAFAIGWTPCIGPVLATILAVAANQNSATEGAALLGVYSAGLGLPFFIAGLAVGPFLKFSNSFKKHLRLVERLMGVLLILTGLMFITGQFTRMGFWLLTMFPALGNLG